MNLTVNRTTFTKHSVIGKLSIEGQFECFTLEPPMNPDPIGNGYVCIPLGTYPLKMYWSTKHQRILPHVDSVPGRSFIEIHIGNFPRDTDGCTLVGSTNPYPDFIGGSTITFTSLMQKLFANATPIFTSPIEEDNIWSVGTITYSSSGI